MQCACSPGSARGQCLMILLKLTVAIGKIVVVCLRFDWLQEVDHLRLRKSLDEYN